MIKIGTCGYRDYNPGENWKERYKNKLQAYTHAFSAGELNRTFYKLPMEKTAARWREEAARGFEFTMKAWQAVTHPTNSPTWRKKKDKLTDTELEEFGNFGDQDSVLEAWKQTKTIANALDATVCVFQASARFNATDENEHALRAFFENISLEGIIPAWEPRGDWNENLDRVESICRDLGLVHSVDLMRREPVSTGKISYIRLHGLNKKETDINYNYSEEELRQLAEKLKKLDDTYETVYCMFNNIEMFKNAGRLKELLGT